MGSKRVHKYNKLPWRNLTTLNIPESLQSEYIRIHSELVQKAMDREKLSLLEEDIYDMKRMADDDCLSWELRTMARKKLIDLLFKYDKEIRHQLGRIKIINTLKLKKAV